MVIVNQDFTGAVNAPVRCWKCYLNNTTQDKVYRDDLLEFSVERIGDTNKFFGFAVCQKLSFKLNRNNNRPNQNDEIQIAYYLDNNSGFITHPFLVNDVYTDEKTNTYSVTCYDKIKLLDNMVYFASDFTNCTSLSDFADVISSKIGVPALTGDFSDIVEESIWTANFDSASNLRNMLDDLAAASHTICFINEQNQLKFKKLSSIGYDFDLTRGLQIDAKISDNKRLVGVCRCTSLGDNLESKTELIGSIEYIRDNGFLEIQENIANILDDMVNDYGNLQFAQYDINWQGNPALEIGDRVRITSKDNQFYYGYVLDDTINFNGAIQEQTQWKYENSDNEKAGNPTNIGTMISQTYAKVDKTAKQINLYISDNDERISQIEQTADQITLEVRNNKAELDNEINELKKKVALQITEDDLSAIITRVDSANEITTTTGFTFNADGLTVSKSGSEMETLINEDGMRISKSGEEVLTADNTGVNAINLTARQYLTIGKNSRFEDYQIIRTGCFYVGGYD